MPPPPKSLLGIVVSAGKMMKAVKVRIPTQTYNRFLKKHFQSATTHLVSDPTSALRTGDVVRILSERQISRRIRHVVTEIVVPWGPERVEERPALLSGEERRAAVRGKTERKKERRRVRREGEGVVESEDDRVEGVVEGTAVAS